MLRCVKGCWTSSQACNYHVSYFKAFIPGLVLVGESFKSTSIFISSHTVNSPFTLDLYTCFHFNVGLILEDVLYVYTVPHFNIG